MSERVYTTSDRVWVGDKEFSVVCYDETAIWNPETLDADIPGYDLVKVSKEYFSNPTVHTVPARLVHHLTLSERVRRIEEHLGLDDE